MIEAKHIAQKELRLGGRISGLRPSLPSQAALVLDVAGAFWNFT